MQLEVKKRKVRSFMRRTGRFTPAQAEALVTVWPYYGIENHAMLPIEQRFGRAAPCILEIGFGMGHSLIENAKSSPHINFLGIEVHRPGIGSVLAGIAREQLTNIRVFCADAIEVLQQTIPDNSLHGVQIFFPDPWQKRRHHKRRLIQPTFIELLTTKIMSGGFLHLATDWENYAEHMQEVLQKNSSFIPISLEQTESIRFTSKFEQRGKRLGHGIWDFCYIKCKDK